jgi:carboxyl-terminal processing protease
MGRLPRWARLTVGAAALLLLLVVAFGAGAWIDQRFPEHMPVFGQNRTLLDNTTQQQALRIIQAHYWTSDFDGTQLSHGSIAGMVQGLGDPFTRYLTPAQYRAQQESNQGQHPAAIGVSLVFEGGRPIVSGVLPASPAQQAGVQSGDAILAINAHPTAGLSAEQVSALIDSAPQSEVTLLVQRGTSDLTLSMHRFPFASPAVVSTRLPDDILYLCIYQFGTTTDQEFTQQLHAGLPARGVVLDLRRNGGGFVSAAVTVVSAFLQSGEVLETRSRESTQVTGVDGNAIAPTVPLVILVDGATASSSEIVAGALQVQHRATLVGIQTFGKGSVQVSYPLNNGGALRLTVQHWLLPNGQSVDRRRGLEPDRVATLTAPQDMYDVATPQRGYDTDSQLQAALQMLGG